MESSVYVSISHKFILKYDIKEEHKVFAQFMRWRRGLR